LRQRSGVERARALLADLPERRRQLDLAQPVAFVEQTTVVPGEGPARLRIDQQLALGGGQLAGQRPADRRPEAGQALRRMTAAQARRP
jgi:hypothetical protein